MTGGAMGGRAAALSPSGADVQRGQGCPPMRLVRDTGPASTVYGIGESLPWPSAGIKKGLTCLIYPHGRPRLTERASPREVHRLGGTPTACLRLVLVRASRQRCARRGGRPGRRWRWMTHGASGRPSPPCPRKPAARRPGLFRRPPGWRRRRGGRDSAPRHADSPRRSARFGRVKHGSGRPAASAAGRGSSARHPVPRRLHPPLSPPSGPRG